MYRTFKKILNMEKDAGKVGEICQSDDMGTMG